MSIRQIKKVRNVCGKSQKHVLTMDNEFRTLSLNVR